MRRLYLGVDGGATWTRSMLVDGEALLAAEARLAGSSNHQGPGLDGAMAMVQSTIAAVLERAGVRIQDVSRIHLALAGDDTSDDHERLTSALRDLLPVTPFTVDNDVWAALRGGTSAAFGVAINCASGSGVAGIAPSGARWTIPDLGYDFGNWGSGQDIGREAFRSVIRAWDGRGDATSLTSRLLALADAETVDDLYMLRYREELGDDWAARCTPVVFAEAANGDAVSIDILQRVGQALAVTAGAIIRRLGMTDRSFDVVLAGGAIRTLESPLVATIGAYLHALAPACTLVLPRLPAVCGACLLAMEADGISVGEHHLRSLAAGLSSR